MDGIVTAATQSLPQMGGIGIVAWVVIMLMRRESTSEDRHTAQIKRLVETHAGEMKRLVEKHREEQAELKADLASLRTSFQGVHDALDKERTARRKVEDELLATRRGDVK